VLELGQLVQVGTTTELLEHPSHLATAYCLGQVSVLTGDVSDGDPHETAIAFSTKTMFVSECGSIRLPLPGTVFREIVGKSAPLLALGLRPDAARPANSPPTLRERVITGWNLLSAEPVGRRWLLQLIRGRSRVCMEWNSGSPPPPGASCPWILATDKLLWFNRATGERIRETTGASGD
jgi:hypothetical protein